MITATVVSDGSFHQLRRKLGPAHAGWAAWVRVDGNPKPIKGFGSIRLGLCQSSNDAELYAALNGIWLAVRAGAEHILVRSDCATVQHAIEGKLKNQRLKSIWEVSMARPDMKATLSARHVKGHGEIVCSATFVQDWCDTRAKIGQQRSRKGMKCLVIS